MIDNMRFTAPY